MYDNPFEEAQMRNDELIDKHELSLNDSLSAKKIGPLRQKLQEEISSCTVKEQTLG